MPETTRISRSHHHGQGIPKKCSDVREHEDKSFAIARAQKECHVHGFLLDSASSVLYRMEQRYDSEARRCLFTPHCSLHLPPRVGQIERFITD